MHLLNQGNSNICIICGEYNPAFMAKSITLVTCSHRFFVDLPQLKATNIVVKPSLLLKIKKTDIFQQKL